MNIIKLKDMIMPSDLSQSELFNTYLKGKYAYWVQMRYIVSFDHMGYEGYMACEEDITKLLVGEDGVIPKPYGAPYIDTYNADILEYIDSCETDRINSTVDLRLKNKYATDNDITIDELKVFRTWLARELLLIDQTEIGEQKNSFFSEIETHVLKYYANGMYDDAIKILSVFGTSSASLNTITANNCSCHQSSDLSSLYNHTLGFCDHIATYRKNIYKKMVEMFSRLEFWEQWSHEFIGVFKKYIDNIINLNLPLLQSNLTTKFIDCSCKNSTGQDVGIDILKRLSKSLEYIKTSNTDKHRNFINNTLYDWSSTLYEQMNW